MSEVNVCNTALEVLPKGFVFQLRAQPIWDQASGSWQSHFCRVIPAHWGEADGTNYMHCTSPFVYPSIQKSGMLPSTEGAEFTRECIYTTKFRERALGSYGQTAELPFRGRQGQLVWKKFALILCFRSRKAAPPFHDHKVNRKGAKYHQYQLFEGNYELLFYEFICLDGPVIRRHYANDDRENFRYRNRVARALELVKEVVDFTEANPGKVSQEAAYVRKTNQGHCVPPLAGHGRPVMAAYQSSQSSQHSQPSQPPQSPQPRVFIVGGPHDGRAQRTVASKTFPPFSAISFSQSHRHFEQSFPTMQCRPSLYSEQ